MIPWLDSTDAFPPAERSLSEPNGLLCAGGDLSPRRIIEAYQQGIFPWYSRGEPILWWSPDPRMVLVPSEFRISRSLRRILINGNHEVRLDSDFPAVITACAKIPRNSQSGTWITPEMQSAYITLHALGFAHSVETWIDGELVGGLYGLCLGRVFYGESMFSLVSNASKIAAAHLAIFLPKQQVELIDCQMSTPHLASLGAREIPRHEFLRRLRELSVIPAENKRWPVNGAKHAWHLEAN